MVKNMRESTLTTPKGRYDSDVNKLEEVLDVNKADIVTCYRAGAKRENGVPRLLIVTLSTPSLAEELHNYGSGHRVETSGGNGGNKDIWINQDLTKSDRDANYMARKLMREKRAVLEAKRQKHNSTAEKKPAEETSSENSVTEKKKEETKHTNDVKSDDSVSQSDPFL